MKNILLMGLSVLMCSVSYTHEAKAAMNFDNIFSDNDSYNLMKNGGLCFANQNYEDAVVFLEKAFYLLELDRSLNDDYKKYRCLYTLFLSYAELGSLEMMVFVGKKTAEVLHHRARPGYELSKEGLNNQFALCSDRPDPPDYERGGCLYERDAQDHYDRAYKLGLEAVEHSIYAGLLIEIPPLAILETYRAVESFKEAAVEYTKGVEIEKFKGGK